jgi:hypothetical protein
VRKRTVKNGMRMILAALLLIIIASFYHLPLSDLLLLSPDAESRIYRLGMFCAAAIGGYGAVVTVFGFVLSPRKSDTQIRLLPTVLAVSVLIFMFFYLLSASFDVPVRDRQRRLRPGETITI